MHSTALVWITSMTACTLVVAEVQPQSTPLYSDCAKTRQMGVQAFDAAIRVTSSIAGEEGTCFKVTATVDGQPVTGAIFEAKHPAVISYLVAMSKPPTPLRPARTAAASASKPAAAVTPGRFEDFSGTNFHDGELFRLSKLQSKVVLVHFWRSAQDPAAKSDAEFLAYLRAQYGSQGLEVVGVTEEKSYDRVQAFNENAEAVWPLVRDRSRLAEKYGVTASSEIFVLDAHRNIIVSGPRPKGLEEVLNQRLSPR